MGGIFNSTPCIILIIFQLFAAVACNQLASGKDDIANSTILCDVIGEKELLCHGVVYDLFVEEHASGAVAVFYALISVFLILSAGLMSGLTIGLMSLDLMNLQILQYSGDSKQKYYASRIIPVVKHHHHMLVTLLLCNAAAMEALPIFLDRLMSPVIAILLSVTAVLFFGEIIPQALCVRFGLAIGARTAWLVRGLMLLTFPITWPISKLLDRLLGTDHGTKYKRSELKELVTMHANINQGPLSLDEIKIIQGAIDLRTKNVSECMTPLHKVFMLNLDDNFDETMVKQIIADGHSRFPIYSGNRQNIVGLLMIKYLLGVDYTRAVPIRQIGLRPLPVVTSEKGLYELLNEFQTGKSHMAAVCDKHTGDIKGIITLEDVIEELIQEKILDETDSMNFEERLSKAFTHMAGNNNNVQRSEDGTSRRASRDVEMDELLIKI